MSSPELTATCTSCEFFNRLLVNHIQWHTATQHRHQALKRSNTNNDPRFPARYCNSKSNHGETQHSSTDGATTRIPNPKPPTRDPRHRIRVLALPMRTRPTTWQTSSALGQRPAVSTNLENLLMWHVGPWCIASEHSALSLTNPWLWNLCTETKQPNVLLYDFDP